MLNRWLHRVNVGYLAMLARCCATKKIKRNLNVVLGPILNVVLRLICGAGWNRWRESIEKSFYL